MRPNAPAGWFELLLDEGQTSGGQGLPESFRAVYGGDWVLPDDRPYVYVNFVTARDGRVSFDDPGHAGGGDVSGFDAHDQWLMGLLRSRADAVMMGDGTLASEPEHLWTAEYVCPSDAEAFGALRRGEARRAVPLTVFVSLTGDLPWDAAVFADPSADTLIATTNARRRRLPGRSTCSRSATTRWISASSPTRSRRGSAFSACSAREVRASTARSSARGSATTSS